MRDVPTLGVRGLRAWSRSVVYERGLEEPALCRHGYRLGARIDAELMEDRSNEAVAALIRAGPPRCERALAEGSGSDRGAGLVASRCIGHTARTMP